MPKYRITVAGPAGDDHDWDSQPRVTLVVSTDGDEVKVAEMMLTPGASGQLVVGDVPRIDLNLLARALLVEPPPTPTSEAAEPLQLWEDDNSESAGGEPAGKSRPYRKMPEPAQVLKVLREEGTVTAMARRFGVPRHTAQGWLQRIRRD